jgi:hypothetical protein
MGKHPCRTHQAVFRGLMPRGRFLSAALAVGTFRLYKSIMRQYFRRVKHKTTHKRHGQTARPDSASSRR